MLAKRLLFSGTIAPFIAAKKLRRA